MVRNYKPKPGHKAYNKYDPELLSRAFRDLANGKGSFSRIATQYKITRSVLYKRYRKHKLNSTQTALSLEREEHIIKYINACAPWEYHLTCWDIRILMKYYLDKRPKVSKRKIINNLPGQELVTNLLKRHKDTISRRIIQNMNMDGSNSVEVILSYFHELKMSTADVNPENIVCYKDTHVTDETEKNKKETEEIKTNDVLVMTAASASGEMLPPYVVYKEQNCYDKLRRSQSKQPRPRLNAHIFEDWFKSVILPYYEGRPGKKCLVGGFFSSRISLDLMKICKEHNIDFVFLPNNFTHLTQPLDSLSQLIHTAWDSIIHQKKKDRNQASEENFRSVVQNLANSPTQETLESFKKTGISPINPEEILKQLPDYNETTVVNLDEEFEKLENMRNGNTDVERVKEEVESSEEYSYDNCDYEIMSIESNDKNEIEIEKSLNGTGKKSKNKEITETPIHLIQFDLKLSPVDFQDDNLNEDAIVDYIPENIMEFNEAIVSPSKDNKSKRKVKKVSLDSNEDGIYYDQTLQEKAINARPAKYKSKQMVVLVDSDKDKKQDITNVTVMDPLSNCRNTDDLHSATTNESNADGTVETSQNEHGAYHTHTRLLEAILTSVTRQEKLQERTALAIEAQTLALTNIARLLEGRNTENDSTA